MVDPQFPSPLRNLHASGRAEGETAAGADRTRTGHAGRTIAFKQTDADRTRAWPFLPGAERATTSHHAPFPSPLLSEARKRAWLDLVPSRNGQLRYSEDPREWGCAICSSSSGVRWIRRSKCRWRCAQNKGVPATPHANAEDGRDQVPHFPGACSALHFGVGGPTASAPQAPGNATSTLSSLRTCSPLLCAHPFGPEFDLKWQQSSH
eukprot:gene19073-biopygen10003